MAGMTAVAAAARAEALVVAALRRAGAGSTVGVSDLLARARRWGPDLEAGVADVYPDLVEEVLVRLADITVAGWVQRSPALRERDRDRLLAPDWFQRPDALGYVAYADRFADTLSGVAGHVDYLRELGTTYLHLMPLLAPRPGANDGGYAVADYREVRADLGAMADLEKLATQLHENGIALTIDLVLNHVAREHEWAAAARAGDRVHREYFHVFPDRTEPDRFERTLPEVFPDFAPGNFTWDEEVDGWVWTTFNSYQWDLNWANPSVLCEFAELELFLANRGVDCLRLDAIAFLWKRLGTDSPEPARGARAHPGPARGRAHRRPVAGVQGRGDRRARPGRALPRRRRARRRRLATWPTTTASWCRSGRRSRPATRGCSCARSTGSRPSPPPRRGRPTCAATTTSAGRSTTPTPARSGGAVPRTVRSSRGTTSATSPAASRAAPRSRSTRAPATSASAAARRASRASRWRSSRTTTRCSTGR